MSLKHLFNSDDDIRIEKNKNGEDVYVFDPYNPLNRRSRCPPNIVDLWHQSPYPQYDLVSPRIHKSIILSPT
jgi:hypothetical protein